MKISGLWLNQLALYRLHTPKDRISAAFLDSPCQKVDIGCHCRHRIDVRFCIADNVNLTGTVRQLRPL